MIYGIDLGTTTSSIGYNEKKIGITVPSIVNLEKQTAGSTLKEDYDAVRSYKIDMSTHTEGSISVLASSIVLKKLREMTENDEIDAVISVPAYFNDDQRRATKKAAKLANINVVGIINEPTAAAILESKEKGLYVIFDLGGGTFDISIIDSRISSVYQILATDGCILGGDDLDNYILEMLKHDCSFKSQMCSKQKLIELKCLCEKIKIRMQKEQNDITVELSEFGNAFSESTWNFTLEQYRLCIYHTFYNAINLVRDTIIKAKVENEPLKFILVGGSCYCPVLRGILQNRFSQYEFIEPEHSLDSIVMLGVTKYAKLLEDGEISKVHDVTKRLSIEKFIYTPFGRKRKLETLIEENSPLPAKAIVPLDVDSAEKVLNIELNIYQGNGLYPKDSEYVGTMVYNLPKPMFGKEFNDMEIVLEIHVEANGLINLIITDYVYIKESLEIRSGYH